MSDRNGTAQTMPWEELQFQSAIDFIQSNPKLAEPVIDGLCRRGETVNLIGSTKEGKSWMILGMALAVAEGRDWLGRKTTQGKVALIDNELQAATLSRRIRDVADAMFVPDDVLRDQVLILSLRSRLSGIRELIDPLKSIADQGVVMVGLDAFYRFIPSTVSENDNAGMASIYNDIDRYAAMLNATFVLNHHSSKGDQSGKRVTDVGSGAGSISRAADSHLIIRDHKTEGLAVLDAACRSFPPVAETSVRFDFPLWSLSDAEPALRSSFEARREAEYKTAEREVLEVLADGKPRTIYAMKPRVTFGEKKLETVCKRLVKSGQIRCRKRSNKTLYRRNEI